jgi:hypothetical protein
MLDTVITLLNTQDSGAAIDYLNRQTDPAAVLDTYVKLIRHFYWTDKNLPFVVLMARAGIQYGLTISDTAAEPELAKQFKSTAKAIAYDLASFTWPGWAEPGLVIGQTDLAVGLDAAKINLRLAHKLDKGDLPLARAYWMLGGQQLAGGSLSQAETSFSQAEHYAAAAGEEGERLLAQAFGLITTLLASPDSTDTHIHLAQLKDRLRHQEHGDQFIDQIDTAWQVLAQG